ncbi:hypothetical protein [Oryza sativa Japonica Group]|uniref:Uncharacterized protein P0702B09.11 n=1 Tax=Oryza sativa subsp. japonica TaxID=39947 RepID=Q5VR63_ORYSJ|nr:hypothetical protein [Oryza sativa Japonica Group]
MACRLASCVSVPRRTMATRWSAVGDTGRRARPARSISAESAVTSFAADRRVNYYAEPGETRNAIADVLTEETLRRTQREA